MQNKSTRFISGALAAAMTLSVCPVSAFASGGGTRAERTVAAYAAAQNLDEENAAGQAITAGDTITPSSVSQGNTKITTGGTYNVSGGDYTGYKAGSTGSIRKQYETIVIDTTEDVTLNIQGNINFNDANENFICVKNVGTLTIDGTSHTLETNADAGTNEGSYLISVDSNATNAKVIVNNCTLKTVRGSVIQMETGTATLNSTTLSGSGNSWGYITVASGSKLVVNSGCKIEVEGNWVQNSGTVELGSNVTFGEKANWIRLDDSGTIAFTQGADYSKAPINVYPTRLTQVEKRKLTTDKGDYSKYINLVKIANNEMKAYDGYAVEYDSSDEYTYAVKVVPGSSADSPIEIPLNEYGVPSESGSDWTYNDNSSILTINGEGKYYKLPDGKTLNATVFLENGTLISGSINGQLCFQGDKAAVYSAVAKSVQNSSGTHYKLKLKSNSANAIINKIQCDTYLYIWASTDHPVTLTADTEPEIDDLQTGTSNNYTSIYGYAFKQNGNQWTLTLPLGASGGTESGGTESGGGESGGTESGGGESGSTESDATEITSSVSGKTFTAENVTIAAGVGVNQCTFKGNVTIAADAADATINGCTFEGNVKAAAGSTFWNCVFAKACDLTGCKVSGSVFAEKPTGITTGLTHVTCGDKTLRSAVLFTDVGTSSNGRLPLSENGIYYQNIESEYDQNGATLLPGSGYGIEDVCKLLKNINGIEQTNGSVTDPDGAWTLASYYYSLNLRSNGTEDIELELNRPSKLTEENFKLDGHDLKCTSISFKEDTDYTLNYYKRDAVSGSWGEKLKEKPAEDAKGKYKITVSLPGSKDELGNSDDRWTWETEKSDVDMDKLVVKFGEKTLDMNDRELTITEGDNTEITASYKGEDDVSLDNFDFDIVKKGADEVPAFPLTAGVYTVKVTFKGSDGLNKKDLGEWTLTIEAKTHPVTIEGGKTDKDSYAVGEKVTVTPTIAEGYELDKITVKSGDKELDVTDNKDGTYSFEMPDGDVEITVTTKTEPKPETKHEVKVNGDNVTLDKKEAAVGEKVTVTPKLAEGEVVDTIEVTANGEKLTVTKNNDGTYSFEMPDGDVEITVTTKKAEEPKPEDKDNELVIGEDGEPTEISGKGWSYDKTEDVITIEKDAEIDLSKQKVVKTNIQNEGTLTGGSFTGTVTGGSIAGGTYVEVKDADAVTGGVFAQKPEVKQNGKLSPMDLLKVVDADDTQMKQCSINDIITPADPAQLALYAENAAEDVQPVAYIVGAQTVTIRYTGSSEKFNGWTSQNDLKNATVSADKKTLTFDIAAIGDQVVTVKAAYKADEPVNPDDPKPEEPTVTEPDALHVATVAVGAAAFAGAVAVPVYGLATEAYIRAAMPAGITVPSNRIELAKLLWQQAGKPEPTSAELFEDIAADDTDAQKAARWVVEQGLLKVSEDKPAEFRAAKAVTRLRVCLTWHEAKAKGLVQ